MYNQNVVIHQNEELQRKSSQSFLPKINGQSQRKVSEMGSYYKAKSPHSKYGGQKNSTTGGFGGQIQYANEVFKDTAVLQEKLQKQTASNEGLRKELF